MNQPQGSRLDVLLDLLADEVAERLAARSSAGAPGGPAPSATSDRAAGLDTPPEPDREHVPPAESTPEPQILPGLPPGVAGPSHAAQFMRRLAAGVLLVVVLINIPLNPHGTTLATSLPSSASLVIRNGLLVKEDGKDEIYVYQDGRFRWISSLDAFEHYGYAWSNVQIVEPGFLSQFETGTPVHVLLKCAQSPHIYRLEGGLKRWIVDIPTFEAEGHQWSDVRMVECDYLRGLPDGETIPPGRGTPPQPGD